MKKLLRISVACALISSVRAEVKLNALFSDNAVLQQNTKIPVWGTARDGEKVTVTFDGDTGTAFAKEGKWMVRLKPHKAGGPFIMTIAGENTITVNNVLVGEVWVCSGQSNMAFSFIKADNANAERPSANYPKLRMFKVELVNAVSPETDVVGKWVECSPETVKDFSAVGYFFGRDLHKATGLPVGMIQSSVGGTPAENWTSLSGLKKVPALHGYLDMLAKKPPQLAKSNNPFNKFPTCYFNGMVAPLIPYAIKGTVWYQGESNGGKPLEYRTLFPLMIADWREKWGQGDFPFLFVQIAPFNGNPPELREAQFLTWKKTPNTAMVVTTDVGEANNIHPRKKEPVGARLALAARALVYGEKIEYSGPEYDSMKINQNKAVLSFRHVGSGMVAKDGPLKGFTIAGADKNFVDAKAEIQGDTVVVSSDQVTSPVAVRYGFSAIPEGNLWNKEGLPASPFQTDPESLTQEPPKPKKPASAANTPTPATNTPAT
jgi:sialate O-acetylesterase